jgi:hypothetical protein
MKIDERLARKKAKASMSVTDAGMEIDDSDKQSEKTSGSIRRSFESTSKMT